MSTFEGLITVLERGVDVTGIDLQPKLNANPWAIIYFVGFMIIGALVVMNLFVGVIVGSFIQLERKFKCPVLLSESQRQWFEATKAALKSKPKKKKHVPAPTGKIREKVYRLVKSTKFEITIMILIMVSRIFQI